MLQNKTYPLKKLGVIEPFEKLTLVICHPFTYNILDKRAENC